LRHVGSAQSLKSSTPAGKRAIVTLARDPFALSPWPRAAPAHSTGQSAISKVSRTAAALRLRAGVFNFFFHGILMTKLYVGNLPFAATEEAVRNLFAPHGTVEKLSLINDRDTGRPRGFGFVEMSNADASRAMQALNGMDFDGRSLKINEAQDKARSGGGSSRY
jgi:RNA recognition motif-containing protein